MMPFLALHRIAAQRGEGLRPELASLMERENHSKDELGFQGKVLTTRALVEAIDRVAMAEWHPMIEARPAEEGKRPRLAGGLKSFQVSKMEWQPPTQPRPAVAGDWLRPSPPSRGSCCTPLCASACLSGASVSSA